MKRANMLRENDNMQESANYFKLKYMWLRKQSMVLFIFLGTSLLTFLTYSVNAQVSIYLNPSYSFRERATDLVSRMTIEEKQSQLGNTMPPIPRLGVKKYDVWGEALHGIMGRNDNSGMTATSFPNSVAVGCTWDPELIKRETKVIADEARGFNHNYIFTLTYWSPVIEPTRDPRWGRTAETFGEDPFHVSQIGSGFIKGLMGDDPTYLKAIPCGKHYFANNTEFNRHTGSSNMDDRDIREFYISPYKALIQKHNLPSIMTAYNAVNGIPMSESTYSLSKNGDALTITTEPGDVSEASNDAKNILLQSANAEIGLRKPN